jgi:hypothetical protein
MEVSTGTFREEASVLPIDQLRLRTDEVSVSLEYSASIRSWHFADACLSRGAILLRNSVCEEGELSEVRSVSGEAFQRRPLSAVLISRTVGGVGEYCFRQCDALQTVAFEAESHLCEIGPSGFRLCGSLRSIAIPSLVGLLVSNCFSFCQSLHSVIFERPSRLATIERQPFSNGESLNRFCIPAPVTTIHDSAFKGSRMSSIKVEEGSVSF